MKKVFPLVLLIFLMVFFAVNCSAEENHDHDEDHVCFTRVDKNKDNKVTPEELGKFYPEEKTLFEKIDENKDGSISHDEYEEYWYRKE